MTERTTNRERPTVKISEHPQGIEVKIKVITTHQKIVEVKWMRSSRRKFWLTELRETLPSIELPRK